MRYLTGLWVSALGLCAGGWLVLTPFAFGYGRGRAAFAALGTGGGLVVVCAAAVASWSVLWRRKLRAEGVLPVRPSRRSRRSARRQERAERLVRASRQRELVVAPDPAQVLTDLRALLTPLLAVGEAQDKGEQAGSVKVTDEPVQVQVPGHLRGAELLMVGTGEEESW